MVQTTVVIDYLGIHLETLVDNVDDVVLFADAVEEWEALKSKLKKVTFKDAKGCIMKACLAIDMKKQNDLTLITDKMKASKLSAVGNGGRGGCRESA